MTNRWFSCDLAVESPCVLLQELRVVAIVSMTLRIKPPERAERQ